MSTQYLSLFNNSLGILTIISQISIIILLLSLIFNRQGKIIRLASHYAFPIGFIIALTATAGSLAYSELMGLTPCTLCWYQRIFMYPQVIILGIALFKSDRRAADYSIVLSGIGGSLAAYHYKIQMSAVLSPICSITGGEANCALKYFSLFNYTTIPLMAFSAFLLIILLMISTKINPTRRTIK